MHFEHHVIVLIFVLFSLVWFGLNFCELLTYFNKDKKKIMLNINFSRLKKAMDNAITEPLFEIC